MGLSWVSQNALRMPADISPVLTEVTTHCGDRCSGSDGHMKCDSGKSRTETDKKFLETGNAGVGPFKAV